MKLSFLLLFLVTASTLHAQLKSDPWADDVTSVTYGSGAGYGQAFSPLNITGRDDSTATPTSASASQTELLTLGNNGSIVMHFSDNGIYNGSGVDFTVFENPFYLKKSGGEVDTTKVFAEYGIVAASKDGVTFYTFPYDTATKKGFAGKTPTNGKANPQDAGSPLQDHSGGDSFDLSDIGLDTAYYIKITDASSALSQSNGPGGFDLDAVVAVNSFDRSPFPLGVREGLVDENSIALGQQYPNPVTSFAALEFFVAEKSEVKLELVDGMGRTVEVVEQGMFTPGVHHTTIDARTLSAGVYALVMHACGKVATRIVTVVK